MFKTKWWTHVCYGLMPNTAECICRKVVKKLKRPALHAFKKHCGTKSTWIAPPNTLTDLYIRFFGKSPTLSQFLWLIRTNPNPNLFFYFTEVNRPNTFAGSLRYLITLLKYTLLYNIVELNFNKITLLSYTQSQHIVEVYPILLHC